MRVEFALSQDDLIAGYRAHLWRKYTAKPERFQKAARPALAVLVAASVSVFYFYPGEHFALRVFIALSVLYLLIAPKFWRRYWRDLYSRTRAQDGAVILTISDDSIHVEWPGKSVSTIEWAAVLGVLDRANVTLLYVLPTQPMVLPRRVLNDGMHDELLSICRSKGIPFTYPKLPS